VGRTPDGCIVSTTADPPAAGVAQRRFRLDSSCRRTGAGRVLIGGSPLRVLTLSVGGAAVIDALQRDGEVEVRTAAMTRLLDRLTDLGIIHPMAAASDVAASDVAASDVWQATERWTAAVTVVTPCKDELPRHPRWSCASVIVDDGSAPPLAPPAGEGASDDPDQQPRPAPTLVRLPRNMGPGGARDAGLERVDTPFVAFVDADVEVDETALASLTHWFDDPRVAMVAPRIRAMAAPGALAAFESIRSPLDLGAEPARVAPTTRVSYVPAAVLVCRAEALRAIGGFDASLRYGEDVDLVWRLVAAGWRCRYDPSVTALHRTRPTLRAWATQRFRYGTSAAPLARRHVGALAPVRMSGWSAATWAPVVAGFPLVGALIGAGTSLALVRKLPQVAPRESLRLAGLGNLYAGRLWCETLSRAWWPIAAMAAVTSRRLRPMVVGAWLVPIVLDGRVLRRDRPPIDPLRFALLHLLDDLAYGAGVWVGAWRERSAAALLPSFESWPPREGSTAGGTQQS